MSHLLTRYPSPPAEKIVGPGHSGPMKGVPQPQPHPQRPGGGPMIPPPAPMSMATTMSPRAQAQQQSQSQQPPGVVGSGAGGSRVGGGIGGAGGVSPTPVARPPSSSALVPASVPSSALAAAAAASSASVLHVSTVPLVPPPLPEKYVSNAATQRQLFDTIKEALLTKDARDRESNPNQHGPGSGSTFTETASWAEFLKCLSLYAQEALTRQEMLCYVKKLFVGEDEEEDEEDHPHGTPHGNNASTPHRRNSHGNNGQNQQDSQYLELFDAFKTMLQCLAADARASSFSANSGANANASGNGKDAKDHNPNLAENDTESKWYCVPLAEIDFTRCRKCTPSYRILPPDYPPAPCSGRSLLELALLNDTWVSLPVGSEESYTFRHMRRNQHEETLFRVEDERFEIDMSIDTNATALRRLEPIAEEIYFLSRQELMTPSLHPPHSNSSSSSNGGTTGTSDGGAGTTATPSASESDSAADTKREGASVVLKKPIAGGGTKQQHSQKPLQFQFVLDRKSFTVIHLHAISRVYGESGPQMLKLLYKNPTKAIPIVLKRLRQKDREWRGARQLLQVRWKELAFLNYNKSLDHRSLTWRTIDKRATSTRTLLAEIKDRAANKGRESLEACLARREKAKEEYGSFYETTMQSALRCRQSRVLLPSVEEEKGHERERDEHQDPLFQVDPTMPFPTDSVFTPHLSLTYGDNDNDSYNKGNGGSSSCSWAFCDAYRILSFALERGNNNVSPADKERCNRLLRDFVGPLFGLTSAFVFEPAVKALQKSNRRDGATSTSWSDPEDHIQEEEPLAMNVDGELQDSSGEGGGLNNGVMHEHSSSTPMNHTHAAFRESSYRGAALLDDQPVPVGTPVATIFGDGIVEDYDSEYKMFVIELSYGRAFLQANAVLCTFLPTARLTLTDELWDADDELLLPPQHMLVFGTQPLYLFLRLHEVLVRRLNNAKQLAYKVSVLGHSYSPVEGIAAHNDTADPQVVGRNRYEAYLSLLYSLLEGGTSAAEGGRYEDRVRSLLGHYAYELATMDKLINHLVKHLQNMEKDDTLQAMIRLHRRHLDAGGFRPTAFRQEAAHLSGGENVFAFQLCQYQQPCAVVGDNVVSGSGNGVNGNGNGKHVGTTQDRVVMHYEFLGSINDNDDDLDGTGTGTDTNMNDMDSTAGDSTVAMRGGGGFHSHGGHHDDHAAAEGVGRPNATNSPSKRNKR
jgi:hypothetical protein